MAGPTQPVPTAAAVDGGVGQPKIDLRGLSAEDVQTLLGHSINYRQVLGHERISDNNAAAKLAQDTIENFYRQQLALREGKKLEIETGKVTRSAPYQAGGKVYIDHTDAMGNLIKREDVGEARTSGTNENVQTLVTKSLAEKLGRTPTSSEVLQGLQDFAGGKSGAISNAQVHSVDAQVKTIGDAIIRGEQPPVIQGFGMAKLAAPLKAYLAEQGYDLSSATQDWNATQKHLATLNGQQQLRLGQAINFTRESLGVVRDLANQWDAGQFPLLNKASLMAAKNGAYGTDAAAIATKLEAQIADVTSELGTVYKGGNSSTDESLKLAAKNLSGDWEKKVLLSNLDQIEKNLTIRGNSMRAIGVAGLSGKSNIGQPAAPAPVQASAIVAPAPTTPTSTPLVNSKGWTLHVDKNGNKAYVSPDKTQFEEVR